MVHLCAMCDAAVHRDDAMAALQAASVAAFAVADVVPAAAGSPAVTPTVEDFPHPEMTARFGFSCAHVLCAQCEPEVARGAACRRRPPLPGGGIADPGGHASV